MTILFWVLCVLGALFAASTITAIFGRFVIRIVYPFCFFSCVILLGFNLFALLSETYTQSLVLPLGLFQTGCHLRLDGLSSFFGVVVNFGAALSSLYAVGYARHEKSPLRIIPFYPAFLASMNLVLLADDAFTYLVAWELMSLVSWALVVSHHTATANRQAGYVYLLMASFGVMALLFAFGILAGPAGQYAFDAMRANHLSGFMAGLVLLVTLVGAGSKAGLFPLHVWLPLAHPAAPSHVSSLMSGVMTKIAVYGFVRIIFDLLGSPTSWWSMLVLALGGITAVMGILYAMFQSDLKRLLAYSTVENIGIIFIGLGLSLAFKANNMPLIAALAMTGALLHVLNHSLFKSLLFFGAGSILNATGKRDIESLGGLIHRMPRTALFFLIGSMSIAALPPLNGFVSEWMTFQAILLSPQLPSWGLKFIVPLVGVLLALTAALASACFIKAYGIIFLGRPRCEVATEAKETDGWSLLSMALISILCVVVGVLPTLFIDALAPVVQSMVGGHMPSQTGINWLSVLPTTDSQTSYNGLVIFVLMTIFALVSVWFIHGFASRRVRKAPIWDCGFPDSSPITQYSASSFSQPIRKIFGAILFRAQEIVDMPEPGETRPAIFKALLVDVIWKYLYEPLAQGVDFISSRLILLQFLTIRRYLMMTFFALISLLIVVALWK